MENLTYLDQKNISFDAIIFLASFHHLDTEQKRIDTLTDIQNLLASHGRIYLTNWNLHDQKQYDPSRKTAGEYEIKIGTYSRYYHGFTLSELTSLFKEAGFKIEEHRVFE